MLQPTDKTATGGCVPGGSSVNAVDTVGDAVTICRYPDDIYIEFPAGPPD